MIELKVPWDADSPKVYSKINIDQADLMGLIKHMIDALIPVEQWDLLVTSMELRSEDGFLVIEAFPDEEYRPGGINHQQRVLEWGVNNCFQPTPVHTGVAYSLCDECGIGYLASRLHPRNGCSFGVVDNVLRT